MTVEDNAVHIWQCRVRDYECDSYGGVNSAIYLNYLEEARKEYLETLRFDLAALAKQNIGFVGVRYEIDYRCSLISGDRILVETKMQRLSKVKFKFLQNIYRLPERTIVLNAMQIGIPINIEKNRAECPDELERLLVNFPIPKQEVNDSQSQK